MAWILLIIAVALFAYYIWQELKDATNIDDEMMEL
jgi:hypothetical protein